MWIQLISNRIPYLHNTIPKKYHIFYPFHLSQFSASREKLMTSTKVKKAQEFIAVKDIIREI